MNRTLLNKNPNTATTNNLNFLDGEAGQLLVISETKLTREREEQEQGRQKTTNHEKNSDSNRLIDHSNSLALCIFKLTRRQRATASVNNGGRCNGNRRD